MRDKIMQALARAYCTERNENKVLDPELILDMTEEILALIGKEE